MIFDDVGNVFGDLLENLIAKSDSDLGLEGRPEACYKKEYNSDSNIHQNRTFVVSENR